MGWEGGNWEVIASPGVRDVAAVMLVCGVAYVMRHAGSTFTGVYTGFVEKLESYRRAARP